MPSEHCVSGLVLLEAMIGDRAFTENAVAQAARLATTLGSPVAGFDAYLAEWRSRREPFSDDAERLLDRWVRFALAPLPGGVYRVRALRAAVEAEWDSIIAADSLAALGRVQYPVMIVQALRPWLGGRPYFSRRIVEAQLRVAPQAELFVAEHFDHGTLVRDPAPSMVAAILAFASRCAAVAGAASSPGRLSTVKYVSDHIIQCVDGATASAGVEDALTSPSAPERPRADARGKSGRTVAPIPADR